MPYGRNVEYVLEDLWVALSSDVTIVNDIQSPVLSLLGAAGIVGLCLWHATILLNGIRKLRWTLSRLTASVLPLVAARHQIGKDWLTIPALSKQRTIPKDTPESPRDLDALQVLDRRFRAEAAVAKDWLSYRKTLVVEQPAWFLEPTVHSQRPATDFFSFEALCADQLNVRFYRQLPSFLTGLGLLFTFIAILIGLSKLHANGAHIEGIQGLINGLSGKFVTSIVGLICANAFTLLENSSWHRLESQHRRCIALLDELFTQKMVDPHARSSQSPSGGSDSTARPITTDGMVHLSEIIQQRLGSTVAALTSATQALTALKSKQSEAVRNDLPGEIAREMQRVTAPLLESVQDLTRSIKNQSSSVQLSQTEIEAMFHELKSQIHKVTDNRALTRGN